LPLTDLVLQQDGTIQPEIKLSGILNTYSMDPNEDTHGWGTQVHTGMSSCRPANHFDPIHLTAPAGVNAHNHQHLFCLRIDPNIDGPNNTVFAVDAVASDAPVGSPENYYGNAFYAKRTKLATTGEAMTDYIGETTRTWDICNESKPNPHSGKPASYKLVSREAPRLLPKEGSLVWKRAGFARHTVHVTKCKPLPLLNHLSLGRYTN
jgi:primary-amine oxidase